MQEKKFIYKNAAISYTVSGEGVAVILIHGFIENKTMWKDIVPVLSENNQIVTVDILGHGNSDNLGYIHTMEDQAKMLNALLTFLHIKKCVLIGHSLGGYISLAFTELYRDKVTGICLLNSTALADSKEKQMNRERAITLVKQDKDGFIRMAVPNLFGEKSKALFKEEIDQVKQEALKTSQQGVIAAIEGIKIRKDRSFILQEPDLKKMMIYGKTDPVLTLTDIEEQVKNTNTQLVILERGHMSYIEDRDSLIKNLKEFVK